MKRTIRHVIIHCSASANGNSQAAADIDAMHAVRGFKREGKAVKAFNPNLPHIGYHFFIRCDGTLETGRDLEEVGAHVKGSNTDSIGVCMSGLDKFTAAQWVALYNCIRGLAARISGHNVTSPAACVQTYKDLGISIEGHRDYSPDLNGDGQVTRDEWIKDCPNFDVRDWVRGGMIAMEGKIL